jgi:hypothetical protein
LHSSYIAKRFTTKRNAWLVCISALGVEETEQRPD